MRYTSVLMFCVLCFPVQMLSADDDIRTEYHAPMPEMSLRVGTVTPLAGYTNRRTGTVDSEMGEIIGATGFTIIYDIGMMAGTHSSPLNKEKCSHFWSHFVNGHKAFSCLRPQESSQQIITTIMGDASSKESESYPANFWATVTKDQEIAEFLLIVCSFRGHE